MKNYPSWFESVGQEFDQPIRSPHSWQIELAASDECVNRLIRIPTGLGKTQGVLLAWAYHRLERKNNLWPRRLAWCLPMRTLVEQTYDVGGIFSFPHSTECGFIEALASQSLREIALGFESAEWTSAMYEAKGDASVPADAPFKSQPQDHTVSCVGFR